MLNNQRVVRLQSSIFNIHHKSVKNHHHSLSLYSLFFTSNHYWSHYIHYNTSRSRGTIDDIMTIPIQYSYWPISILPAILFLVYVIFHYNPYQSLLINHYQIQLINYHCSVHPLHSFSQQSFSKFQVTRTLQLSRCWRRPLSCPLPALHPKRVVAGCAAPVVGDLGRDGIMGFHGILWGFMGNLEDLILWDFIEIYGISWDSIGILWW